MNPKEFTEKQKVRVIYDPNGMHIREEDVYELMQRYADQQLILSDVSNCTSCGIEINYKGLCEVCYCKVNDAYEV